MTARNDDRLLSAWLHDIAPAREPEHLLGQVLARTARTRRRAAWRTPERWNLMSAITSRFAPAAPVPWPLLAVAGAVLMALVAGLVLVASGAFQRPAPPFGPAANGQIYYSENGELYARTPTGQPVALLSGPTVDTNPVLSFDGTKLTFLRHGPDDSLELWSMYADGSNVARIPLPSTKIGWFEWAPCGDAALALFDDDPGAITFLRVDGSTASRHELGVAIDQAFFRPTTGSQVAFLGGASDGTRGIYLVNPDGAGLKRLELDPGFRNDPDYAANAWAYFWTHSWSPSGETLLYTQLEPVPGAADGNGFRVHLAQVDAAGKVLSDRILEADPSSDDELAPQWLPGGDGMVFQSVEGSRQWLSYAPIGPDGIGPVRELPVAGEGWIDVAVSPDGTTLIAITPAPEGVRRDAYLIDIATGTRTQIDMGEDATWQRRSR